MSKDSHSHGHHHHHAASGRMGTAFFLNLSFAIIELIGGLYTNSLAILSDAFHDFGDALAIGLAWFLEKKSLKGTSPEFSYGHRRLSVLAALITGLILLIGSGTILVKAIPRLFTPEETNVTGMFLLSVLGITVNGFAAYRMSKGSSLNERMILWHLLEDVMGWGVIFIGSLLMMIHPMPILDPIMAIGVAVWVLWNVFKNLKKTIHVFLQGTPDQVQIEAVKQKIIQSQGVQNVHHLHLWSMDGTHHILTMHLIVQENTTNEAAHELKAQLKKSLFDEFHITEATIEIEWPHQTCTDPIH
ncbi:MAG: cation transporter [Bdellovibrionaceae bacterium]|nr:cation transporter [Pseudobdellovibrionaceae bacterium]